MSSATTTDPKLYIDQVENTQNELVMARLRHEELEADLVRYKLLCVSLNALHYLCASLTRGERRYAEAMHQSEDAMSTNRVSMMSLFSRRASSNSS